MLYPKGLPWFLWSPGCSFLVTFVHTMSTVARSSADQIQVLLDILLKEMMSVAHGVSEMEVSRARNQLKASLLMNLESKSITAEDIGR